MLYLVNRALRRLKWNIKIYVFIVLELVIGFTIIANQMNVTYAVEERLEAFKTQYTESGISVNAYSKDLFGKRELPVTKKDYDYIVQEYGQILNVSYISYGSVYTSNMETITVCGMSETALQKMFQTEADTAYIGAEAKRLLGAADIVLGESAVTICGDEIEANGTEYLLLDIPNEKNKENLLSFSAMASADIPLSKCIIIPLSLQEILEEYDVLYNCSLELIGKEGTDSGQLQEAGNEIVKYLLQQHEDNTYETENKIAEYEKGSNDLSETVRLLSWVAKFSLFLVVVGMVGVLFILLEKRKKDFIISFWVGAEKWKLVVELLLEMLFLCVTAGGISLMLSYFMAPTLSNARYTVSMTPGAAGVVLLLSVVIAGVTGMTSLFYIKSKNARV